VSGTRRWNLQGRCRKCFEVNLERVIRLAPNRGGGTKPGVRPQSRGREEYTSVRLSNGLFWRQDHLCGRQRLRASCRDTGYLYRLHQITD
jgi:hypothetical protein